MPHIICVNIHIWLTRLHNTGGILSNKITSLLVACHFNSLLLVLIWNPRPVPLKELNKYQHCCKEGARRLNFSQSVNCLLAPSRTSVRTLKFLFKCAKLRTIISNKQMVLKRMYEIITINLLSLRKQKLSPRYVKSLAEKIKVTMWLGQDSIHPSVLPPSGYHS